MNDTVSQTTTQHKRHLTQKLTVAISRQEPDFYSSSYWQFHIPHTRQSSTFHSLSGLVHCVEDQDNDGTILTFTVFQVSFGRQYLCFYRNCRMQCSKIALSSCAARRGLLAVFIAWIRQSTCQTNESKSRFFIITAVRFREEPTKRGGGETRGQRDDELVSYS